jgi:hypothetical protein
MNRRLITVGLLSGLLTLTAARAAAQTTDVVMNAYFVLNGLKQARDGGVTVFRMTNKDILAALNATGDFQFPVGAVLLFRSVDDDLPSIVVREVHGSQTNTTEVGNYFGLADVGSEVHTRTHLLGWGMWAFAFDNGLGTEFHLWGLNTLRRSNLTAPGVGSLTRAYQVVVPVTGEGATGNANSVFYGTIYGNKGRIEVD